MANELARIEAGLALLNEAKQAIARAAPIQELKQIRDQSEALRSLAQKQGLQFEIQNLAAESKVRTERAIGKALDDMKRNGQRDPGGRGKRIDSHAATQFKLADLGIDRDESSRWQRIASIPESKFERYIESAKSESREITSEGARKLAKACAKSKRRTSAAACPIEATQDLPALIESGTKFGCVYADPPWQYENQATRASTDNHYSTMTVSQIAALPIAELVADEALLFLWTTNGFLFESKQVIDAWGFEFKSSMVWVKPQIGIGNYVRNAHEFLLICSRGGMRTCGSAKSQRSWVEADRLDHSRKPETFREIVEDISTGPRIELFARERHDGWTVWGNQISDSRQNKLEYVA